MGEPLDLKLNKLILMFNKFVEENHKDLDKDDLYVKNEWSTFRPMLEDRPVKMAEVYQHINGVGASLEPPSPTRKFMRANSQRGQAKVTT
jgi:hypothetical protein